MRIALTLRLPRGDRHVLVRAHPEATLRELFAPYGLPELVYVDGRRLGLDTSLSAAGLRDGSLVAAQTWSQEALTATPGTPALLVACGPAAGASRTLPSGTVTVGRSAPLPLADDEVSDRHLEISADSSGSADVADLGSTNGTVIAGTPVSGRQHADSGELIWAGRSALTVAIAPPADAAIAAEPDGWLRYSRSPRMAEPPVLPPVSVPDPPPDPEKQPFPLLAVIAPALAGVLMAVLLRQLAYLAFVALSPLMVMGNAVTDRRRGKRAHRQRLGNYQRQMDEALARLRAARLAELSHQRHVHPDPATLLLIAVAPNRRLWERQSSDDDFLELRVGTGTRPRTGADPGRADAQQAGADLLIDAPIVLPLAECGAIGLVGRPEDARALARGMLLSLAVLHSPRDVAVTLLTGPRAAPDWEWLAWLPHARQDAAHDSLVRIGNDAESNDIRIAELQAALRDRRPGTIHAGRPSRPEPVHVVVLDGSYQLRLRSDLSQLLREGPAAGLCFICLDDTPARLPQECRRSIVTLADDRGAVVAHVSGPGFQADEVAADVVSARVCEAAARVMAPISDAGGGGKSGLPASLRYLDAAGLDPPAAAKIRPIWDSGGRTTGALLGARADGPFVLDLAQGPHLLVAGTTGSGKSELLQTLVASLAAANRPDAMNFVLIDYKGGAAFLACQSLPHTVGVLTDLDEFLVDRALTSLRAELQRRKSVLGEAGKTNIQRYWDALASMPDADPLPRLVIVVDEFAVMAEQLPGQLKSLVEIGAQGRSLGIHLVLATQRPAGVVSADMRANMNLRIALRVASPEDSRDVIETVDAARIPAENSAGRAFAWLGGGRPVAFQAARVGGLRPGARPARLRASVDAMEWLDLGHNLPASAEPRPDPADPTDLSTLVAAIGQAAADRYRPARSPWCPPLPESLTADQLASFAARPAGSPSPLAISFGLTDYPRDQRQAPAILDLARGGHLLIAGAPQSGRTTLLRTIAGCLATQLEPGDAHVYAIDCGGGGLTALGALPQCGAVVTPDAPDRIDRLLGRLSAEQGRRAQLLAAGGYGDLAEYRDARGPAGLLPYLVVLVDRYDAFVTALEHIDNGRLVAQLQRLIRDGLAAGVRIIMTGDRSLLTGRLAGLVEDKIVLRMADQVDYALAGLSTRAIPARMPNGRGLRVPAVDMLQVALLSEQARSAAQNQALREIADRVPAAPQRPFRVDPLPTALSYERARELPAPEPGLLVGVGGDELAQVRAQSAGLLVIGQHGSGRSTALAACARSLADDGFAVVLVTPRRSVLPDALPDAARVTRLTSGDPESAGALSAALAGGVPTAIIVDDAELLADTPLADELLALYRAIRDSGHRLVAATTPDGATAFRGLVPELAKAKCGLVLEPTSPADGMPLGARLPLSVIGSGVRLRAAFVRGSTVTAVQIPDVSSELTGSGLGGLVREETRGSAAG